MADKKLTVIKTRLSGRTTFPNGLYDLRSDVYNVNSLKHIVDEIIEHGGLESFSTFPFGSYAKNNIKDGSQSFEIIRIESR